MLIDKRRVDDEATLSQGLREHFLGVFQGSSRLSFARSVIDRSTVWYGTGDTPAVYIYISTSIILHIYQCGFALHTLQP